MRTLSSHQIEEYAIISSGADDPVYRTSYARKVYYMRNSRQIELEDFRKILQCISDAYGCRRFLLAPTTENLNRFFLSHREILESLGCLIPITDRNLYRLISDKMSFGRYCHSRQLPVPPEIDKKKLTDGFTVPFVAKPKSYFASDNTIWKPVLVLNSSDFDKFFSRCPAGDFYYQHFLSGESHYLLYYFCKDGTVYKYSQINLAQQPEGKSILAALGGSLHREEIAKKYEELFLNLGYYGFVMIELRKYNGEYYMIEANPRMWGPSQLFVDAGRNFFEVFLSEYGYLPARPVFKEHEGETRYMWTGGFAQTCRSGQYPAYYGEAPHKIFGRLSQWIGSDIFNREDTLDLFEAELTKQREN